MPPPRSDWRQTACFELRHRNLIVGPLTFDQIRAEVAETATAEPTSVRRVTPWLPIQDVWAFSVPSGQEHFRCVEIRCEGESVGPVSLDLTRRALTVGRLPLESEVRIVWRWQSVGEALEQLAANASPTGS
ncbi:MAG: hypothetical protein JRI23_16480 [Deltaproteobacteria bacterium]|nr:hypothetical protein [Deltaproteobacteria bacterium]MBW2533373.1 hypothetical protein [Deltaproteobacteria bacterium]